MSFYYFDTESALGGDPSKSIYDFSIDINPTHDRISLYQIELPKSMYNLPSGSNTFYIGATLHTIPPGNYTLQSLLSYLNAINGLVVTFSKLTGKFTFTGAFPYISFPQSSIVYLVLGFAYLSVNGFVNGSLVSTNVINLQTNTTINLHCTLCRNDTLGPSSDLLQKLEIANVSDYNVFQFQNEQIRYTSKILVPNKTLTVKLTNEYDEHINLNGLNFNFVLCTFNSNESNIYNEKIFTLLYNTIDKLVLQK